MGAPKATAFSHQTIFTLSHCCVLSTVYVYARVHSTQRSLKEQLKHAMTVQSAHMITMDYIALSQPLSDGMLLNDRTEHRLKLIHSLGELQPMHTYTTEYGNVLKRPSKYKVVLAGSIEFEITTDEADFDAQMGRLALQREPTASLPDTSMRMTAYDAFSRQQQMMPSGANGHAAAPSAWAAPSAATSGRSRSSSADDAAPVVASMMTRGQPVVDDPQHSQRLREEEALGRINALVARLAEMEGWFASVKGEAERERRMREQSTARLSIMQERVELLSGQLDELQKENALLRRRVSDVTAAHEDELVAPPIPLASLR